MKIVQVKVANFRGIAEGIVHFDGHSVLVGDNNAGKSTLLEAIDLVLGPERLSRRPVVDEHDFYAGQYLTADGQAIPLSVEVIVADLNEVQLRHFREHIEWWDKNATTLLAGPPVEGTDAAGLGLRCACSFGARTTLKKTTSWATRALRCPPPSAPASTRRFAPPTSASAAFSTCERCVPARGR